MVRDRKGEYGKVFEEIQNEDFQRVRVDGVVAKCMSVDAVDEAFVDTARAVPRPPVEHHRRQRRLGTAAEHVAPVEVELVDQQEVAEGGQRVV